jgi:hypothetical protein
MIKRVCVSVLLGRLVLVLGFVSFSFSLTLSGSRGVG